MRSCISIESSRTGRKHNINRVELSYLKCLANDYCMLFAEKYNYDNSQDIKTK